MLSCDRPGWNLTNGTCGDVHVSGGQLVSEASKNGGAIRRIMFRGIIDGEFEVVMGSLQITPEWIADISQEWSKLQIVAGKVRSSVYFAESKADHGRRKPCTISIQYRN